MFRHAELGSISVACYTVTIATTTYRANFAPSGGRFEIQQAGIAEIHMDTPRARPKNTPIEYPAVSAFCVLPLRS